MTPARALTSVTGRLPVAILVALGLGISGCGGSEVEYQEVPGGPVEINLPDRTPATPADEADEETAAEETPAPEATQAPAATEGAAGATTEDGAVDQSAPAEETPAATEDSAATDEPPAPGSDAERFEDFCEQNAGAC